MSNDAQSGYGTRTCCRRHWGPSSSSPKKKLAIPLTTGARLRHRVRVQLPPPHAKLHDPSGTDGRARSSHSRKRFGARRFQVEVERQHERRLHEISEHLRRPSTAPSAVLERVAAKVGVELGLNLTNPPQSRRRSSLRPRTSIGSSPRRAQARRRVCVVWGGEGGGGGGAAAEASAPTAQSLGTEARSRRSRCPLCRRGRSRCWRRRRRSRGRRRRTRDSSDTYSQTQWPSGSARIRRGAYAGNPEWVFTTPSTAPSSTRPRPDAVERGGLRAGAPSPSRARR